MAMRGVHDLSIIEVEIFKGAFELGWDAYDAQLLKPSGGIELDEFGRTDAQLEFEVNEQLEARNER
jgi:hypothetical protein